MYLGTQEETKVDKSGTLRRQIQETEGGPEGVPGKSVAALQAVCRNSFNKRKPKLLTVLLQEVQGVFVALFTHDLHDLHQRNTNAYISLSRGVHFRSSQPVDLNVDCVM